MNKKIVVLILLAIIYFTGSMLIDGGTFKTVKNKFDGEIVTIYQDLHGTEDLDIDREKGLLFISSSDRWSLKAGNRAQDDGIYVLQLDSGNRPIKLSLENYREEFHPHGISFFKQNGQSYLYVINHNENGSSVVLFQYMEDRLSHLKSIKDEMMCCPNDLVAVDTDKFYVTNDHGNKDGIMRKMEDYMRIASSYLLYYDGSAFIKAYEDLNYANGVALSNDGKTLYLTHTTGRELLTFDRNPDTGFLAINTSLKLGTGVDNITVDENDIVWVGAHPKLFAFVAHAGNPEKESPSEVIKITPYPPDTYGVDRVYQNDGKQLSGSSVALSYKGELLVGAVFEKKLLRLKP